MIRLLNDKEIQTYIADDVVRPHLSAEYRNTQGRHVWGLFEDKYAEYDEPSTAPQAIICVAYTDHIPQNETELHWYSSAADHTNTGTCAVFYTVWSYSRGSGQTIVNAVAEWIQENKPQVQQWVTLSPLTEMAERFHLRNGATLVNRYDTCQVFEYTHQLVEEVA